MYDQYYELTGRPFQLTPDPRFYFESATHRKALSYLGYGLAQGEGFIVITGEIGAGKTTLVRHLMSTVDPGRLTAATIVTTQVEGGDLLHMVAESFGIAVAGDSKSDCLHAIEQYLHEEARQGRRCLLVVDEAQNLPTATLEELRMLSNFQLGNQALLQIFLLGQPEFRDQLRADTGLEQLRQRVIATHHLEAMQPGEMEPYITHRLSKVGWTGRPDFTSAAIDKLYQASGGIPRRLNMLMTRVLLMGAVEQVDRIELGLIENVLADIDGDGEAMTGAPSLADPTSLSDSTSVSDPETSAPVPFAADVAVAEPVAERQQEPQKERSILPETASSEPVNAPKDIAGDAAQRFFRPGVKPAVFETVPDVEQPPRASAATSPAAAPMIDDVRLAELTDRMDMLDKRVEDQEATIKRLVAMLLDYVERDDGPMHRRAA